MARTRVDIAPNTTTPTFALLEAKRRNLVLDVVEGSSADDWVGVTGRHNAHQLGDVHVQHVVHLSNQFVLEKWRV